jgi:hypothetical protein
MQVHQRCFAVTLGLALFTASDPAAAQTNEVNGTKTVHSNVLPDATSIGARAGVFSVATLNSLVF